MKRKVILMLSLIAIMVLAMAVSISAAYYCDKDGNLVEAGSDNIAYEFDAGNERNIDGNRCFRVSAVYLYDTSITKIVFPVAEQIKSGYQGIAPQAGWSASLGVYAVDENGARNTEVSYAAQIEEIEFLSGVDFDGANGKGTFSGFTGLKKLVFNGNVSMGNDATNKGGMFNGAPITSIEVKGSGNVNLVIARHISTSNNLTVVFDKDCTSHVYVLRGSRYFLPSATVSNWTFVFNPNLTYGVYSNSDVTVTPICDKGTPTTKIIIGVDVVNDSAEAATSHGLLYSYANQEVIQAELKGWCELGYADHKNDTVIAYKDGYASQGAKIEGCSKCNSGTTTVLEALFTNRGYSVSETGIAGIAIGFEVNHQAIKTYEELTGKAIKYGVFAVLESRIGTNDIFDENGKLVKGVIGADLTTAVFSIFELKIAGFSEEQKEVSLAMGAYVVASDDNGVEYSYLQNGKASQGQTYYFTTYNDALNAVQG